MDKIYDDIHIDMCLHLKFVEMDIYDHGIYTDNHFHLVLQMFHRSVVYIDIHRCWGLEKQKVDKPDVDIHIDNLLDLILEEDDID